MNNMEEKTSFRLVFGDSPLIKVLDFFLDNQEFDYSLTDIAKEADVGWSTLHQFWDNILKLGLVKKTRRIGRAELYKLNTENPIVKKLIEIDNTVSETLIKKEQEKQRLVA
jgi:predicted transcriptional regulator